jgi:hypothetical protein
MLEAGLAKRPTMVVRGALLVVIALGSFDPAPACSCERDFDEKLPHERMEQYEAVFAGQVTTIRAIEPYGDVRSDGSRLFNALEVTLETGRIWKGQVPRVVTIYTNASSGMCNFPFVAGQRYLVYATLSAQRRRLETSICTPTCGGSDASRDIDTLDRFVGGHAPDNEE